MSDPIRAMVVEDEDLFRDALRIALDQTGRVDVVAAFADGESALAALPRLRPRAALLDIALPGGMNGVHLGRLLRRQLPRLAIVLLSHLQDPAVLSGVPADELAGWSYLSKAAVRDVPALLRTLEATVAGEVVLDGCLLNGRGPLPELAPRQATILGLLAQGYSNSGVARRLGISLKTVENQINSIFRALEIDPLDRTVQPRVRAVLAYLRAMGQT